MATIYKILVNESHHIQFHHSSVVTKSQLSKDQTLSNISVKMSVYVVTGVSRGIGFEFMKQLSEDPNNLFVGLVRNKEETEKKVAAELGGNRTNIHIISADLASHASLKQAAIETERVVGDRGIDYLVANGAYLTEFDAYGPLSSLSDKVEELEKVALQVTQTNIIGTVHLFNLFVPLVLKGKTKKVIHISSGMADIELIDKFELVFSTLYSAGKAATNVVVAKYSAQYKKDGVLFFSLSPGVVNTAVPKQRTPEETKALMELISKVAAYAPEWKGPITPEESVTKMRTVLEQASIEGNYGGSFISHHGNKQWV
ncbi:unnamed protein product [Periconia digitata]|uniref:NAD(P)-binding protein n=1 Tax=Periconia digitata TaxID=1303443 RepID=A0A9W4XKL3_9PLEO|nr:unnamed protein product [Periconia digitata]